MGIVSVDEGDVLWVSRPACVDVANPDRQQTQNYSNAGPLPMGTCPWRKPWSWALSGTPAPRPAAPTLMHAALDAVPMPWQGVCVRCRCWMYVRDTLQGRLGIWSWWRTVDGGELGLELPHAGKADRALHSLAKGKELPPMRDARRGGQWPVSPRTVGLFILDPWQRVNDEPALIQPLMPHIRGEEAEEDNLLSHPGQCVRTAVPKRGCQHNDIATLTHHGLHPQGIVVPEVTALLNMQMILVRQDKHHREVCAQCTPGGQPRR